MRRRVPPVDLSRPEPPPELIRFQTRASSPRWKVDDFAAWLRARAAWRDAHPTEPLPGLPARERVAINRLGLPQGLVESEQKAPRKVPEWERSLRSQGYTDPRQVLSKEEGSTHG